MNWDGQTKSRRVCVPFGKFCAIRTLPSPSPRPSPSGRGGTVWQSQVRFISPDLGKRSKILPLPQGEGRGEGDADVQELWWRLLNPLYERRTA
jgi:hypothetical protein